MSKIDGIKLNGTVLEIETGSNVDIHIEDDTLVINTDGTSSGGSSGGNVSTIETTIINKSLITNYKFEEGFIKGTIEDTAVINEILEKLGKYGGADVYLKQKGELEEEGMKGSYTLSGCNSGVSCALMDIKVDNVGIESLFVIGSYYPTSEGIKSYSIIGNTSGTCEVKFFYEFNPDELGDWDLQIVYKGTAS